MKVYIGGPIKGYSNRNISAFAEAERKLLALGHEPINPHNIPVDHEGKPCIGDQATNGHGYGCYMIPDLKALLDCQGYTLLNGWENSRGAKVEKEVAMICGLEYVEI